MALVSIIIVKVFSYRCLTEVDESDFINHFSFFIHLQ